MTNFHRCHRQSRNAKLIGGGRRKIPLRFGTCATETLHFFAAALLLIFLPPSHACHGPAGLDLAISAGPVRWEHTGLKKSTFFFFFFHRFQRKNWQTAAENSTTHGSLPAARTGHGRTSMRGNGGRKRPGELQFAVVAEGKGNGEAGGVEFWPACLFGLPATSQ